jgi:hypothetical protein
VLAVVAFGFLSLVMPARLARTLLLWPLATLRLGFLALDLRLLDAFLPLLLLDLRLLDALLPLLLLDLRLLDALLPLLLSLLLALALLRVLEVLRGTLLSRHRRRSGLRLRRRLRHLGALLLVTLPHHRVTRLVVVVPGLDRRLLRLRGIA